jgi:hypothetical protein
MGHHPISRPRKNTGRNVLRHIGARLIKPELSVDLMYPDYKAGLLPILEVKNNQLTD